MRKAPIDREYASRRALQAQLRNAGSLTQYAFVSSDPSQLAKGPLGGTGAKWWQQEEEVTPGPGTADAASTFLANNPFVWNRPAGCMGAGHRTHPADERARDHPTPSPQKYDVNPWAVGVKTFAEVSRRHPLSADIVEFRNLKRRIRTLKRKAANLRDGKVIGSSVHQLKLELKELPRLEARLAELGKTATPDRLRQAYRWKNYAEPWNTSYARFPEPTNDSPGPQAYNSKSMADLGTHGGGVKFSNIVRATSPRCPPGLSLQSMHFHNGVPYAGTYTTPRLGPGTYLPDVYPAPQRSNSYTVLRSSSKPGTAGTTDSAGGGGGGGGGEEKALTAGEHFRRQRAERRFKADRKKFYEDSENVHALDDFDPEAYTRAQAAKQRRATALLNAQLEEERHALIEANARREGRRSVVIAMMPPGGFTSGPEGSPPAESA